MKYLRNTLNAATGPAHRRMRGGRQSQPVLFRSEWTRQAIVRCETAKPL